METINPESKYHNCGATREKYEMRMLRSDCACDLSMRISLAQYLELV